MNNALYRLLFNAVPFTVRATALAALCAFGMQPVVVNAQTTLPITPDKSGTHPVVTTSASGIPVVNIVAPGKGNGVSNNRFTQYNVGTAGVVIANNGQAAQTQIAGWVQGNPFLGNDAARLVLFQVNGGIPSQLLGPTEIAGQAAPFVLANPAGITCSGCGFINVPRATLTTGLPDFNADGSLKGFDVTQGAIGIGAGGLSAPETAIELIARAMTINAQLWAKSIDAVAGANQVDYASGNATAQTGTGPAPQFAIDVQALGSMYGNGAVRLIGTEAGVGVRDVGGITSINGTIRLSANGDVTIEAPATLQALGNLQLEAPNVANAGTIVSGAGSLAVNASGSISNSGAMQSGADATLTAKQILNGGAIQSATNATLDAQQILNSGTLQSGTDATLNAQQVVNSGTIQSSADARVTAQQMANSGTLVAGSNVKVNATGVIDNSRGQMVAGNALSIDAAAFDNDNGTASAQGAATIHASDNLTNRDGILTGGTSLTVGANAVANEGVMQSAGDVNVSASGDLLNAGQMTAGHDLNVTAGSALANQGTMSAAHAANVSGVSVTNAEAGEILGNVATNVAATGDLQNDGLIDGGATKLTAGGTLTNTGRLYGDSVTLGAASLVNGANGNDADGGTGTGGVIASRGDLDIGAQTILNHDDALVFSQADMRIGGALDANGHATGAAGTVTNDSTQIQSMGSMTIDATTLNNLNSSFRIAYTTTDTGTQLWFTVPGDPTQYSATDVAFWQTNNNASGIYGENWQKKVGDDDYYRIVRPSTTYPFDVYGTSTQPAPTKLVLVQDGNGNWHTETQYTILPGASQWTLFNVASPAAIPDYVGPPTSTTDNSPTLGSIGGGTAPTITLSGNDALSFCRGSTSAACAPVNQWLTDSAAAYAALTSAINAYNADFRSRASDTWNAYQVDTQTTTPVVVSSKPAQILSGGAMSINVENGINDASQIIAGGMNQIVANVLDNSQPTAQQTVSATGTAIHSHVVSGGALSGDERKNDSTPYTAAIPPQTITLPIDAPAPAGASPAKQAAPDAVAALAPNLALPGNALYHLVTTPDSPFLIVTDPRFANYRTWLSGDSMVSQLGGDPASTERFIGDGFYQQQLIEQQIIAATGQRFIGDYTDNEAEYQALMNNGVKAAQQFQLNIGTALTEAQIAALTSDIVWFVNQTVTLPDGTTQTVLVPQVYLVSNDATLDGSGAIIAGRNVTIEGSQVTNSGTIASQKVTVITSDTLTNSGTLSGDTLVATATQDLNNLGGLIKGNTVGLAAGHDLNLTTTTSSAYTANGDATGIDRVSTIQAGTLTATASNDLNAKAAAIATTGDATLAAGHDLSLTTVTQSFSDQVAWDAKNHSEHAYTADTGTQISTGGSATLAAGNDINAKAAWAEAGDAVNLAAGHDVNLTAGQSSVYANDEYYQKDHGLLSSKSTHTIDTERRSDALGTMLSGDTVNVQANHDVTVSGSTIAGTGDVNVVAGHDINVTTAQTTSSDYHYQEVKKSGLGSSGGIGISVGTTDVKDTSSGSGTGNVGSLIGSTDGSVHLQTGNDLHVTGSDLIAAQDVTGVGANVIIDAAQGTTRHEETHEVRTTGLTLGLAGSIGDAINGAYQQTQAATDGSGSARADALHAIAAAGDAAIAVAGATGGALAGKDAGIAVQLSFGTSHSRDTFTEQQTTHTGSSVIAGGTAAFVATGDGTPGSGNVTVAGSNVNATDVVLAANNTVNLVNTTDTDSTHSSSASDSASVGVSVGTNGWGVSASMSKAHGDANSDAALQNNTHVNGSNSVTIQSGGDTNIVGASVTGGRVVANVGGNLNIASVQDTTQSNAHQSSAGGGISVGMAGGSASFSAQNGHADGTYAQVGEQAGIHAGSGGFDITVAGNTDLKGAVISSIADADKNSLTTGTLTYSDIQDQSHYSANSAGISAGVGVGNTGKATGPGSVSGSGGGIPMALSESGDQSATTRSAVSAGTISITNQAAQTQDVSDLSRDTTNTNGAVSKTPDVNAILNQQADTMQAAQAAGQVVAQGIAAYANDRQETAQKAADAAKLAGNLDSYAKYLAEANSWAEGGTNRTELHIAGGALLGGLGGGGIGSAAAGAAGAGVASALAGKLNGVADQIGGATGSMTLGNVTSNVLAGLSGAVVGGGMGAFTASNADLYNRSTGNAEGNGGTGSQLLDWIGDQFASAGRGAQNLANQFAALVNANGSQGSYVSPDDLNGPGGNSTPPATGGSAVPVAVCVPPVCTVIPAVTPGTPGYALGYGAGNATLNSGNSDNSTKAASTSDPSGPNSTWDTSVTSPGSKYPNVESNLTAEQFTSNLISNGYSVAKQGTGKNGDFTVLSNGTSTYTVYTRSSTGSGGAQYFGPNGNSVKFTFK